MDESRFDRLIQLASGASSRRNALTSALGGVAATAAVAIGLSRTMGETEAKNKNNKKRCKKCKPLAADARCTTNKECCTNETNRACAVAENASNSDKTCCGGTGGACGGFDGLATIAPHCCADYSCSSNTTTPGVCQPNPIP